MAAVCGDGRIIARAALVLVIRGFIWLKRILKGRGEGVLERNGFVGAGIVAYHYQLQRLPVMVGDENGKWPWGDISWISAPREI